MRYLKYCLSLCLLSLLSISITAQDDPSFETVSIPASDELMLVGDFYLPEMLSESGNPTVLLFHMLGGARHEYYPVIPDLLDAGYVVLNADVRGHGETGGTQDWDLAVNDVSVWIDWLQDQDGVDSVRIASIGGSIGSNVALLGCADHEDCIGVVALSPGLDYQGVKPEPAVVDGLADRAVMLVASHGDRFSAESVQQMFTNATGDVSARIYQGNAHGTRLFRSNYESVSHLILSWLEEHLAEGDAES